MAPVPESRRVSLLLIGFLIALALWTVACGGGGGSSGGVNPPPEMITSVTISPTSASVPTGGMQQFMASVTSTGTLPVQLGWTVNGVANGNSTVGTITTSGNTATYHAPAAIPAMNPVTVTVTATQGTSSKSASAIVTIIVAPPPIKMQSVSVSAGSTTSAVNVEVGQRTPSLLLSAVGVGNSAGATAVTVKQGGSANLFLVGQGVVQGTFYEVTGSGVQVTQPVPGDFSKTTDGTPAVNININVSASAAVGPRNILVTNPAGEISVLVGSLLIVSGP